MQAPQDPRTHESQPLSFAGKSLIAMFLLGAGIVLTAIFNYIYGIYGQAFIDALWLLLVVGLALGVGVLIGQERR